jgi:hypothetical protein
VDLFGPPPGLRSSGRRIEHEESPAADSAPRKKSPRRDQAIFLAAEEAYSIPELAALWQVYEEDVRAVFHDELASPTATDDRIAWALVLRASVGLCMLRPLDVERALGGDFTRVRPETWKTVSVVVHVPTFVTEALTTEPALPADLPLNVRIEQLLVELFTNRPGRTVDMGEDVAIRPRT